MTDGIAAHTTITEVAAHTTLTEEAARTEIVVGVAIATAAEIAVGITVGELWQHVSHDNILVMAAYWLWQLQLGSPLENCLPLP